MNANQLPPTPLPPRKNLSVRHVLLVDDTVTPRTLLQVHLMGMGFSFDVASDGQEALRKARRRRPDLVITDIRMPKMDGMDLCRAIRGDVELQQVPVVLLTSHKEESVRRRGLVAGATAFLTKPVNVPELRKVVDDVLAVGTSNS